MLSKIELQVLAGKVAGEMGAGWAALRVADHNYAGAVIEGPEGLKLHLRSDYQTRGRVAIGGLFPHEVDRAHISHEYPSIQVGETRPARGIAGDIKRKLLDEYAAELSKAKAEFARQEAQTAEREQVMGDLAGLFGEGKLTGDGESYSEFRLDLRRLGTYGDVQAYGAADNVSIRLKTSLPRDLAAKVLRMLAEAEEAQP